MTRLDAIPFGIVVNKLGRRFYDEGEAIWPKRYAIWGGLIAGAARSAGLCIVDSKTIGRFLPPMFKPYQADSLERLAASIESRSGALSSKRSRNTTAQPRATSSSTWKRRTEMARREFLPPKSNWAIPIDRPPFYALPLRPGITFTYMGVAVDETGRVLDQSGTPVSKMSMRRAKSCPEIF